MSARLSQTDRGAAGAPRRALSALARQTRSNICGWHSGRARRSARRARGAGLDSRHNTHTVSNSSPPALARPQSVLTLYIDISPYCDPIIRTMPCASYKSCVVRHVVLLYTLVALERRPDRGPYARGAAVHFLRMFLRP